MCLFFFCSVFKNIAPFYSQVHVQNATLAGGVAIGSVANLKLGVYPSISIGSIAGILSVLGYAYITVSVIPSRLHLIQIRFYFRLFRKVKGGLLFIVLFSEQKINRD